MSVLVTGLEIQRFAGLAFLAGVMFGCQRTEPDVAAMVEDVVATAGEAMLASEDLSEPHSQRLRWRVRIGGSWSVYRDAVSRRLSEAGFRVEAIDGAVIARMATTGDTYHVEIRPVSTAGPEPQPTVRIDFTGSPF